MSTGATLPLEAQLAVPTDLRVSHRRSRRRPLGAMLFEAQMTAVAVFDFLGGTVAIVTTGSPEKKTPIEDRAARWTVGQTSGVLAVADGLGGHAGGERASRLATEAIQKSLQSAAPQANESQPTD